MPYTHLYAIINFNQCLIFRQTYTKSVGPAVCSEKRCPAFRAIVASIDAIPPMSNHGLLVAVVTIPRPGRNGHRVPIIASLDQRHPQYRSTTFS